MIVDEVQAGMGRTGEWWSIENFGVEPDIVCAAKGIASGVPLGAMIARRRLMTWPRGSHGNTYGGNPLACAAALATIDLIENGYRTNAARVGVHAREILDDLALRYPSIGEVRGIGLMIGVDFVKDRQTRIPAEELRNQVVNLAFEHGLLLLGCGKSVVRISPPLCVTESEMDEGLEIFAEAVRIAEEKC
jgi:4-aminobutyrate aminotransferase